MSNVMAPDSFYRLHMSVVAPKPIIKLKAGPAMHPVTAISPKPLAAMDLLAKTSPRLLPQDRSVKPSREDGNCVKSPKSSNKSMISSASMASQTILMRKHATWNTPTTFSDGAVVLWVRKRTVTPSATLMRKLSYWMGSNTFISTIKKR